MNNKLKLLYEFNLLLGKFNATEIVYKFIQK